MQKVIIINGPAGVGKTTVSKLLASKSNSSVCIHGDDLKAMIVSRKTHEQGRLGYKNGASLINNFCEAGYDLIIFEYIFPTQEHVEYLVDQLRESDDVHTFTLWADKEVVLRRERGRERESLGQRVEDCYEELKVSLDSFSKVIQTGEQAAVEVVEEIWRIVTDQAS